MPQPLPQPLLRVPSDELQALIAEALAESLVCDYHPLVNLPIDDDRTGDHR